MSLVRRGGEFVDPSQRKKNGKTVAATTGRPRTTGMIKESSSRRAVVIVITTTTTTIVMRRVDRLRRSHTSPFCAARGEKCVLVRSGPAELQQYQDEADAPGKHLRTNVTVKSRQWVRADAIVVAISRPRCARAPGKTRRGHTITTRETIAARFNRILWAKKIKTKRTHFVIMTYVRRVFLRVRSPGFSAGSAPDLVVILVLCVPGSFRSTTKTVSIWKSVRSRSSFYSFFLLTRVLNFWFFLISSVAVWTSFTRNRIFHVINLYVSAVPVCRIRVFHNPAVGLPEYRVLSSSCHYPLFIIRVITITCRAVAQTVTVLITSNRLYYHVTQWDICIVRVTADK